MSRALPKPPSEAFKGQAIRGAAATGTAQMVKLLVQIGSVVVLSRLLSPSDFGVMAMTAPVLAFVMMFQDFGLTQATVQKSDITHEQVSGLFWVNFGVSVALALLLAAASPLVGWFYKDHRVALMSLAFSVIIIIGGLGSQHAALLNRNMRFGPLSIADAAAAAAGLATSAVFAYFHAGYWSLFAGSLVASIIPTAVCLRCAGWRPSGPTKLQDLKGLLDFGAGITGFNFVNFFSRNLDNILIGRAWGGSALGLYDRAYKLLLMPIQQVNWPIARVMFPVLSRLAGEPDRYRAAYLRTLQQLLLVVMPGVAFMVGTAMLLVPTLLGEKWAGAAPIFAALGLAALIQPVLNTTGWLFISQGRTRAYMVAGIIGTTANVLAFFVGLRWGALGVATAYTISEYAKAPLMVWLTTRSGPVALKDVIGAIWPQALGAAVSLASVTLIMRTVGGPPLLVLGLCLAVSYLATLAVVGSSKAGREALKETFKLAAPMVDKLIGMMRLPRGA